MSSLSRLGSAGCHPPLAPSPPNQDDSLIGFNHVWALVLFKSSWLTFSINAPVSLRNQHCLVSWKGSLFHGAENNLAS